MSSFWLLQKLNQTCMTPFLLRNVRIVVCGVCESEQYLAAEPVIEHVDEKYCTELIFYPFKM